MHLRNCHASIVSIKVAANSSEFELACDIRFTWMMELILSLSWYHSANLQHMIAVCHQQVYTCVGEKKTVIGTDKPMNINLAFQSAWLSPS